MVTYIPNFVENPDSTFLTLKNDLNWVRRETTPRSEYYINEFNTPYTYGKGRGVREYKPQPTHPIIENLTSKLLPYAKFEVCFLNRYHDQSDQLGWHSDDSPEMDDTKPIAIISLGAEREIWFSLKNPDQKPIGEITKLKLQHGSLCLMQDTHLHRIPKAGFLCGERISLTFRGYINAHT